MILYLSHCSRNGRHCLLWTALHHHGQDPYIQAQLSTIFVSNARDDYYFIITKVQWVELYIYRTHYKHTPSAVFNGIFCGPQLQPMRQPERSTREPLQRLRVWKSLALPTMYVVDRNLQHNDMVLMTIFCSLFVLTTFVLQYFPLSSSPFTFFTNYPLTLRHESQKSHEPKSSQIKFLKLECRYLWQS